MSNIAPLAAAWIEAKRAETKANAERIKIEEQLVAAMEVPAEGSKTHSIDGYKITVTQPITRKLDEAAWAKVKAKEEYLELLPKRAGVIILQEDGYARITKPCKIKDMKPERRLNMLARLAWRNGDLSKRTNRTRVRVFIND